MLRDTIIRTIRDNKGPLYVEVILSPGSDPSEVKAIKSDVIAAYRDMPNGETGMAIDFLNGAMFLVFDHTEETRGQ